MPTFVQILDFIGTFAFAISGIRLASAKRFDWFGAYVVGFVTAIGGGTIRDVLLGVTPSNTSRIVPPPMAVTKPTTYAPNQSKRFAEASRMPLIAKANVPIKSSI